MSEDANRPAAEKRPCNAEGCDKAARPGGKRCWSHYEQGACTVDGCDRPAKRAGLCWGHHEHRKARRHMAEVRIELEEPRGGGRDKAGLPRRTLKAQLIDAAIALADADAEGAKEAFDRAFERLRMAWHRHGRGEAAERQPHIG